MRPLTLILSTVLFSFVLGVSGLSRAEEAAKVPPAAAGAECPRMKKGEGGDMKDCPHMKGGDCACKHEGDHKAKGDCPCAKGGEAPADCPCHGKGKMKPGKKVTGEKKAEKKETVEKKEDAK